MNPSLRLASLAADLLREADRAVRWYREDARGEAPRLPQPVAAGLLRDAERTLGEAGLRELLAEGYRAR